MHRIIVLLTLQLWIVAGMLVSTATGEMRIEQAGWLVYPVLEATFGEAKRVRKRGKRCLQGENGGYWRVRANTWHVPMLRSLLLWVLWQISGQVGTDWLQLLPWLVWLLPDKGGIVGRLKRGLWEVQRMVMVGYLGMSLIMVLRHLVGGKALIGSVGMSCVAAIGEEPKVEVVREEDGSYLATLRGNFTLRVDGASRFRIRLLMVFLGLLQGGRDQRASRRTRDGRTPFVRQEQLASWFEVPQERVSQYTRYWLQGDWSNLLSLKSAEVLTVDLLSRIVTVFATFPTWNQQQVYQYLHQQGIKVTYQQVEQAAEQSGWRLLQATLLERYHLNGPGLRLREKWLVQQLLAQVQNLLTQLEAAQGLPPEAHCSLADLQTLAGSVGVQPQLPFAVRPWMSQVEQVVFGSCENAPEESIRCTYCGSTDTAPKSKKPRWKTFLDAEGKQQRVAVYRYYCHNPQCGYKTFTHFPTGLTPYSPYRTQFHLLALQMYAWGYSTYRRSGTALGVASMTVWRWVSMWGHDLLPVAALFGVVKSSGVVGVDEKYVLVPKNDKPEGDMRRWMYVYLAVDVWTYDLLHIAIYPYNDQNSANAFLLALRAKGYHPKVIVTDLRQDYGSVIAQVFHGAVHHECIFHALQNVQQHIKDAYGSNYAQKHPEAVLLKQQIYALFETASPTEAHARYQLVLALKQTYLQTTPASEVVFDFLERHWSKLVNAIGSDTIPTTNNTVELVIRRFDQHYQNFCGFESIESAQHYLGVFEKLYRFTPFSQDAQIRIRGKSPLQLAGYEVSRIPLSTLCSGMSIDWPTEVSLVPN